jgi:hypothetical protein
MNLQFNENVLSLLRLIRTKADVAYLLRNGLTLSQISLLIADAIEAGLITNFENELRLTQGGLKLLVEHPEIRSQAAFWIRPDESHRVEQLKQDEIFLPRVKDTFFGKR